MELNYTDEATFITEKVQFSEEHVDVTEKLMNLIIDNDDEKKYRLSPMIVGKDKKSLVFSINLGEDRVERERGDRLYKVKIEKFETEENKIF